MRLRDSEEARREENAVGLSEMAELYAQGRSEVLSRSCGTGFALSGSKDRPARVVSAARTVKPGAPPAAISGMEQALDSSARRRVRSGRNRAQAPAIRKWASRSGPECRGGAEGTHEGCRADQCSQMMAPNDMAQLSQFQSVQLREDSEHVAIWGRSGRRAVQYLRSTVRGGPGPRPWMMAGLLSRIRSGNR